MCARLWPVFCVFAYAAFRILHTGGHGLIEELPLLIPNQNPHFSNLAFSSAIHGSTELSSTRQFGRSVIETLTGCSVGQSTVGPVKDWYRAGHGRYASCFVWSIRLRGPSSPDMLTAVTWRLAATHPVRVAPPRYIEPYLSSWVSLVFTQM